MLQIDILYDMVVQKELECQYLIIKIVNACKKIFYPQLRRTLSKADIRILFTDHHML
jgi:hypothetical protein